MNTPSVSTSMRFTAAKAPKKIKFLGEEVEIFKLTVGQVLEVQKLIKNEKDEEGGLQVLMYVIKTGCPEFQAYSDEDLQALPMESLTTLSTEIMKHSGLAK